MFSLLLVLESDFAKKKRSDRPSNTALPKRDAPISLGSLQDALCSTMCKVLCAMQYSYSHFILNRVTTVFSVANPLFPICVCLISALNHLYVMGQSGVGWRRGWGSGALWCSDALCGWWWTGTWMRSAVETLRCTLCWCTDALFGWWWTQLTIILRFALHTPWLLDVFFALVNTTMHVYTCFSK